MSVVVTRRRRYFSAGMQYLRKAGNRWFQRGADRSGWWAWTERFISWRLYSLSRWLVRFTPPLKPGPDGWSPIVPIQVKTIPHSELPHVRADNCLESGCPRCWADYRSRVMFQRWARERRRAKAAS